MVDERRLWEPGKGYIGRGERGRAGASTQTETDVRAQTNRVRHRKARSWVRARAMLGAGKSLEPASVNRGPTAVTCCKQTSARDTVALSESRPAIVDFHANRVMADAVVAEIASTPPASCPAIRHPAPPTTAAVHQGRHSGPSTQTLDANQPGSSITRSLPLGLLAGSVPVVCEPIQRNKELLSNSAVT